LWLTTCIRSAASWAAGDFLFDHQSELDTENVIAKLTGSIESAKAEADLREFKSCLNSKGAAGRIDDDLAHGH
jgi:hypothetical protein